MGHQTQLALVLSKDLEVDAACRLPYLSQDNSITYRQKFLGQYYYAILYLLCCAVGGQPDYSLWDIAAKGKPPVLSAGMSYFCEIEKAVRDLLGGEFLSLEALA